ncbi:MAG: ABC transporter permease [Fibrobacteres bacterium]|nr:ABC transporter permease [Fibrobacterota bacterium]
MRELGLIAMASFRETVRDKILYTLLFFVLLLLAFAKLLGEWSVFDREKVVANFSLGVMSLGGLAIAIFIGIGLIQKEIQRKTILTLLSKPIHRWQFLVGKYLGLLMVLVINIVVMTIALFLVLHFSGSPVNARLLLASYETFWEMAVITAVALVFSSFSTPVASALLTFGVFLASHLSGGILQYLETMKKASEKIPGATPVSPVMEYAAKTARLILPDLEVFNIRAAIVHGTPLPEHYLLWSTLHGLGWTVFLLTISSIWFSRRDFV